VKGQRALYIGACATALALAGCGLHDPYDSPSRRPGHPEHISAHRPGRPQTATPAGRLTVPQAEATGPRVALETFGELWTNWSFKGRAVNRRELAALSSGALRATLLGAARRAAADSALRASNLRSRGQVAAVLLRPGRPALVVTQETAELESGRSQTGYAVYLARAVQTAAGWKVVEWQAAS
jgi:hypothetical protein